MLIEQLITVENIGTMLNIERQQDEFGTMSTQCRALTFLWQGQWYDTDVHLINYRYRTYNPSDGQFMQRDPIGIWGDPSNIGNGYAFGGGNHWNVLDPWGLKNKKLEDLNKKTDPGTLTEKENGLASTAEIDLKVEKKKLEAKLEDLLEDEKKNIEAFLAQLQNEYLKNLNNPKFDFYKNRLAHSFYEIMLEIIKMLLNFDENIDEKILGDKIDKLLKLADELVDCSHPKNCPKRKDCVIRLLNGITKDKIYSFLKIHKKIRVYLHRMEWWRLYLTYNLGNGAKEDTPNKHGKTNKNEIKAKDWKLRKDDFPLGNGSTFSPWPSEIDDITKKEIKKIEDNIFEKGNIPEKK